MRRERFVIPKVFVCKGDVEAIVDAAFSEKKYEHTVVVLKKALESKDITVEQKNFINELDKYLAYLINQFLKDSLSITNMWIDSFIDDVPVLFGGYLEKKYGPLIVEKLRESQEDIYKAFLTVSKDDEFTQQVVDHYGAIADISETDEDNPFQLVIFEQNYTVSSIRATSSDLRLDKEFKETAKSIDGILPALTTYCNELFKSSENVTMNWAGHLLLTSDGKVFNFFESPIMNDLYLVKELDTRTLMP